MDEAGIYQAFYESDKNRGHLPDGFFADLGITREDLARELMALAPKRPHKNFKDIQVEAVLAAQRKVRNKAA